MAIQQISVFLENRAGQLSEITKVLAQSGIDLRAIHIAETADYGVLRIITTRPQDAASILLEHGFVLSMTPVIALSVPDQPGGLAGVLEILAEANIDIEYMYSVFGLDHGQACMIFRVDNLAQMEKVLAEHGISPLTGEALGL